MVSFNFLSGFAKHFELIKHCFSLRYNDSRFVSTRRVQDEHAVVLGLRGFMEYGLVESHCVL